MKKGINTTLLILLTSTILGITVSFNTKQNYAIAILSFIIIITTNIIAKKITAHTFEAELTLKPWSIFHYGLKKKDHFKDPIPMSWLPILLTLATKGYAWWLAILEFDVEALPERASKRHGLYKFSQMTERHIGLIAFYGILANIILAAISYVAGFEYFTKLNIYYAAWCLLPISSLDGTKIFFSNKVLWGITTTITAILTFVAFSL